MRLSEPSASQDDRGFFVNALLENSSTKPRDRKREFIVSVLAHAGAITIILLAPLYFTADIDFDSRATQFIGLPAAAPGRVAVSPASPPSRRR